MECSLILLALVLCLARSLSVSVSLSFSISLLSSPLCSSCSAVCAPLRSPSLFSHFGTLRVLQRRSTIPPGIFRDLTTETTGGIRHDSIRWCDGKKRIDRSRGTYQVSQVAFYPRKQISGTKDRTFNLVFVRFYPAIFIRAL